MLAEIVRPNWHVLFLHFPIALLTVGVLSELLGRANGSARTGGRWMILWGALLAVPTAASGMFALRETAAGADGVDLGRHWHEVVAASPWTELQWTFLSRHVWLNGVASALALLVVCTFVAVREPRPALRAVGLVLLLASLGLMAVGSWHGGDAVYTMATAVEARTPWPQPTFDVSIVQVHVVAAGVVFALLALSLARTLNQPRVAIPAGDTYAVRADGAALRPAWALTLLLTVVTAAGGIYLVAGSADAEALERWWSSLHDSERLAAHAIGGGLVFVLALGGLVMPRAIGRWRPLAAGFTLLTIAAMAAQLWFGTLLLFDSHHGELTRFAPAPVGAAPGGQRTGEGGVAIDADARRAGTSPQEARGERMDVNVAGGAAATPPQLVVEITGDGTLEPAEVTVPNGAVVEWHNATQRAQTLTGTELPPNAEPWPAQEVAPGATVRRTFVVPGQYRYTASAGDEAGASGVLIVEPRTDGGR